jgi:ketosteroid isomerase-like protein
MKRRLLVLLLVIAPLGCQNPASVEKGARDAVRRYTEALLKNDIETLDKLWGEDLIFIDSRGRVQTKPQRMADIRSGANTFKAIELQDTFTKSSGNHVLLFTRGILRAQYGGKDTTGEYRIQVALSRQGQDWHIHAIQMTPIAP